MGETRTLGEGKGGGPESRERDRTESLGTRASTWGSRWLETPTRNPLPANRLLGHPLRATAGDVGLSHSHSRGIVSQGQVRCSHPLKNDALSACPLTLELRHALSRAVMVHVRPVEQPNFHGKLYMSLVALPFILSVRRRGVG